MNIFTVSLFGHREIENLRELDNRLTPILKELMQTKEYVSFIIGRHGEFDEYAASLIKLARKEIESESSEITLVLPYAVTDLEFYEKYYDNILIPDSVYRVHPKSAILLRNRWMVEQSDLVIVYVTRDIGGAYTAMKYAKRLNKKIINLSPQMIDE